MKKIISIVLLIAFMPTLAPFLSALTVKVHRFATDVTQESYTYLLLATDKSDLNTDSVILVNYSVENNSVSFLQLPRDTYVRSGYGTGRLNSIYASKIAKGAKNTEAAFCVQDIISRTLGIRIDGFVLYNQDSFTRIVDLIGGVDVEFPYDIKFVDSDGVEQILYNKGTVHMNGAEALKFVRFRKGYLLADVARVDAQKLFLRSFFAKLKSGLGLGLAFKLITAKDKEVKTNIPARELISILLRRASMLSVAVASYASAPGLSYEYKNGGWYYVLNRKSSITVIENLGFCTINNFDSDEILLDSADPGMADIYFSNDIEPKIYDDNTVSDIEIKMK